MNHFLSTLRTQRWDDHRFYHQSRINQSLHLVSALSFLCAYALVLVEPAYAAIVGWCIAMVTRQAGHFFFEPRGYDTINHVTDAQKEDIKVGYNIRRKIALLSVWLAIPVMLAASPSLLGWIEPARNVHEWILDVGNAWFALGVAGLGLRTVHLVMLDGVVTGLAWAVKILTDPFHDLVLYHRAPLHLLRGEWYDPMEHVAQPRH